MLVVIKEEILNLSFLFLAGTNRKGVEKVAFALDRFWVKSVQVFLKTYHQKNKITTFGSFF